MPFLSQGGGFTEKMEVEVGVFLFVGFCESDALITEGKTTRG